MTFTDTEVDHDLDELVPEQIPCGGNEVPVKRPCPHNAPATLVAVGCCEAARKPSVFKCFECYREWYLGSPSSTAKCLICGTVKPRHEWYRPI